MAVSASQPRAGDKSGAPKPTAMIVDDDAIFREYATEVLSGSWSVRDWPDGTKMLAWLATAEVEPAFMILDMKMPVMDGPEVLRRVREITTTMPVLLCTSLDRWQVEQALFEFPKVGYLSKGLGLPGLAAELAAVGVTGPPAGGRG